MRSLLPVCRGVRLAKSQKTRDIGLIKLIDFWNRSPRFNHPAADRAPQGRHFFSPYRSPLREVHSFGLPRFRGSRRRRAFGNRRSLFESDLLEPLNVSAQVAERDSTARFTSLDASQIDTELPGNLSNRRSSGRRSARLRFVTVISHHPKIAITGFLALSRGRRLLRFRLHGRRHSRTGRCGGALFRGDGNQNLSDAHLHAFLYVNFRYGTGCGRGDGANRFLRFKLHEGLVLLNLLSLGHQNVNDRSGFYTFG